MHLQNKSRYQGRPNKRGSLLPLIFVLAALTLAGCTPGQAGTGDFPAPTQSPAPSPSAVLEGTASIPAASSPQPSISTPTALPAAEVFLPQLESQPGPSPTVTWEITAPFQICSPLSIHPIEELREITSDPYRPPPPGREERHHGVDFSYYRRGERTSIQGVGVQVVVPGRVAASLVETFPYGNLVIIETKREDLPADLQAAIGISEGQSLYSLYAHMDKPPLVQPGEAVSSCQALGEVGKSGNAAEPHLHLESRLGPSGRRFTAMAYYGAKDTEEERSNYVAWRTGGEFTHFDPMVILYFTVSTRSPH